jgi:hypothetical protein
MTLILLTLLALLCYGLYRELRAIDRSFDVEVPKVDPRPKAYVPQWQLKDWATPIGPRPRWKRTLAVLKQSLVRGDAAAHVGIERR